MTLKEKLRVAEDNSEGAKSFTVGGLRYARCRTCGELWNISKTLRLRGTGYQCPKCYYAEQRKEESNV